MNISKHFRNFLEQKTFNLKEDFKNGFYNIN